MAAVTDKKPFPEADVDNELNPAHNKRVEPDSTSSSITTSQANKEKAEVQKKNTCGGDQKKDCCGSNLKRTVIISVIVAAVAAAAFGIAKKLKEKQT